MNKQLAILKGNTKTYVRGLGWTTASIGAPKPYITVNGQPAPKGLFLIQVPNYLSPNSIKYYLMKSPA